MQNLGNKLHLLIEELWIHIARSEPQAGKFTLSISDPVFLIECNYDSCSEDSEQERILLSFVFSLSSCFAWPRWQTQLQEMHSRASMLIPHLSTGSEDGKGNPCELESVVEIAERREFEKEISYDGVWTTGFTPSLTGVDMTLQSLLLVLQTDLGVNHDPGPRLATGRRSHRTDLSSTAKALKPALIGTAHRK